MSNNDIWLVSKDFTPLCKQAASLSAFHNDCIKHTDDNSIDTDDFNYEIRGRQQYAL